MQEPTILYYSSINCLISPNHTIMGSGWKGHTHAAKPFFLGLVLYGMSPGGFFRFESDRSSDFIIYMM